MTFNIGSVRWQPSEVSTQTTLGKIWGPLIEIMETILYTAERRAQDVSPEEFIIIDQKYTDRIDNLDEIYADVICIENGGWDKDDHFQFQAILDQHSFDLHRREPYTWIGKYDLCTYSGKTCILG
ncbi:hypothetical protein EB796_003038 [Bugula neritina]|uniref:Uncharacterized protein n=1 Tax=Bugula neritina TaxID=10212 RepID=A0A7J7KIV9_BUGNE|nr:hypothetical protein EB796_003038 [Bugula neritina]